MTFSGINWACKRKLSHHKNGQMYCHQDNLAARIFRRGDLARLILGNSSNHTSKVTNFLQVSKTNKKYFFQGYTLGGVSVS
jgi:hypothetical protein